MRPHPVLYRRDLPGGGYVVIETALAVGDGAPAGAHRARLVVERRAAGPRRAGHTPPVIAQQVGPDARSAADALRAVAADNVQLAQAMRRWAEARRLSPS